jgi:N-ethylmaleimide reductase
MTVKPELFSSLRVGDLTLSNRLAMAPMARRRATKEGIPSEHAAEYYSQRASAGLIITEGTAPCAMGKGSGGMPGLYDPAQLAGWKKVTDAVHARGGKIFVQIMHSGRVAHSSRMPGGVLPIAPSAIRCAGQAMTANGPMDYETPRELALTEIPGVVADYANAARCAREAGFDGVELHGASGFLPSQFLSSGTNKRTDGYGGSATNRARFMVEVLEAMSAAIGRGRVGVKIAPENPHNDIVDATPVETYSTLVSAISALGIAYVHMTVNPGQKADYRAILRPLFNGAFFLGGGLTRDKAADVIASGAADVAVFGVLYLANPDLAERFQRNAALNTPDRDTFYSGGAKGYIDYPLLAATAT